MRILGIETSCDETSAAVVDDGRSVLSNVISSSQASFKTMGGVIPEEAARKQVECILPVIRDALAQANSTFEEIDAIAVTNGPGLLVSLLVGTTTARTVASVQRKPLISVHHTLGHLSSVWLDCPEEPSFPVLTLSASGGHTDLWLRTSHTQGTLVGRTRDDAAGEAFDKGAVMLGLSYPGGPSIAKSAEGGDRKAFPFPLPLHDDSLPDFSFSGLKTALKYLVKDLKDIQHMLPDVCASYEHALCAHLLDGIRKALTLHPECKEVHVVGGVSANTYLRSQLDAVCNGRKVRYPQKLSYCTDNAAMIASAAFFLTQEKNERAYDAFRTIASQPLTHLFSKKH